MLILTICIFIDGNFHKGFPLWGGAFDFILVQRNNACTGEVSEFRGNLQFQMHGSL
jgi:hypothetical protein